MADFKLKPLEDRIVVQAERGRRDDGFWPRDPGHGQGEAPGGHRRRGRPRPVERGRQRPRRRST